MRSRPPLSLMRNLRSLAVVVLATLPCIAFAQWRVVAVSTEVDAMRFNTIMDAPESRFVLFMMIAVWGGVCLVLGVCSTIRCLKQKKGIERHMRETQGNNQEKRAWRAERAN
ncbi:TPA: hypothetical protein NKQ25_003609 [Vibrio parahaemolyticus]|nr:hypothetical protein [Vibrio parahaemolyticus]